jgi:hypothetical protein
MPCSVGVYNASGRPGLLAGARNTRRRNSLGISGKDTIVSANKSKAENSMEQASLGDQPGGGSPGPSPHGMGPGVQSHLGLQLRAVYDDLASQPIPDRFLELLDRLERQQPQRPAEQAAAVPAGDGPGGEV